MIAFILTFTLIVAVSGAACGALAYEGRCTTEQRIQSLCWSIYAAVGFVMLTMLTLSAVINSGVAL